MKARCRCVLRTPSTMANRKPPTTHGLAVVDKPSGVTSHDVVAMLRRKFGERQVGHAGTLDPDATGVLLVGVGKATRLLRFLTDLGKTFYRVFVRYGFMEQPDIPKALEACGAKGLEFNLDKTSFFLSREVVVPKLAPPMMLWRELFFIWMLRNAQSATDFFRIPTNRVVELGTLVEI